MKVKDGVISFAPHPSILHAMEVVNAYWWKEFGEHATVTSIHDKTHSFESFHYGTRDDIRTRAFDVRTRDLGGDAKAKMRNDLRRLLGTIFDVVLESDHLHIELDMKKV